MEGERKVNQVDILSIEKHSSFLKKTTGTSRNKNYHLFRKDNNMMSLLKTSIMLDNLNFNKNNCKTVSFFKISKRFQ